MGFSVDEPQRAGNAKLRFQQIRWGRVEFPLFYEEVWMSRRDCVAYLEGRVPHVVPRSACVFCPYKSNREWRLLRDEDPKGWDRAVEVDRQMREEEVRCAQGHVQGLYVHRSGVPLDQANLGDDQPGLPGFSEDCEGGCGL